MVIPIMTDEHVIHRPFPFNVGNVLSMTMRTIDLIDIFAINYPI